MAFKTDGSSHKVGIKNEKMLREYLQKGAAKTLWPQLSNSFEVIKRGGTTYKQDLEVTDGKTTILISAKRKEANKTGSFDYVNSSSLVNQMQVFQPLVKEIKTLHAEKPAYGRTKLRVREACYETLLRITPVMLKEMLISAVADKNKDMHIIVTESSTSSNWEYKFRDTPLYHSILNHTPKVVMGRGIDSANVIFTDSMGNSFDHNLRIRVVTNNGITALIGESKSNKDSIPVVKFQQDKVKDLIQDLVDKGIARKF